jgi:hypothetical protein
VRGELTGWRVCAGSLSANGCRIATMTLYTFLHGWRQGGPIGGRLTWLWSCLAEAPVRVTWRLTKMAGRRFFEENRHEPHHSWSPRTWLLRWLRRRGLEAFRVRTIREDLLHEPPTLRCHADRLMTAMPRRVVHDGATHCGYSRQCGQFNQPFKWYCQIKRVACTVLGQCGILAVWTHYLTSRAQ